MNKVEFKASRLPDDAFIVNYVADYLAGYNKTVSKNFSNFLRTKERPSSEMKNYRAMHLNKAF